ncbi:MAG: histidinol-phosphate transaminase [Flavobacteriales bacterium]|nr:histidinol-phosphate transaminase [Flavobacteriales bacterium]MCB9449773.1 histidinol-phosphate transaminase [Flavobacteriales bacterium]
MFRLEDIIRPNVKALTPYASARDEFKGSEGIFLDANENPFGSVAGDSMNRYPDPLQWKLKKEIAGWKGVKEDQIFLGNGSDEVLDLLIRAFCEPKIQHILITPPTYGVYAVYAAVNDVPVKKVQLNEDFSLDAGKVLAAIDDSTRLVFICSPNNPTGNIIPLEATRRIAENFNGIVVVDEAYADFAETPSAISLLNEYPNIFVVQTFSKAWGMAALRLGMGFASREIVQVLNKIKPPYNINAITQQLGWKALQNQSAKDSWVAEIRTERKRLMDALPSIPCITHVYPSDANFILVKTTGAAALYRYLTDKQIIVRNRASEPGCSECLRLTVGTPSENNTLLEALRSYPSNPSKN